MVVMAYGRMGVGGVNHGESITCYMPFAYTLSPTCRNGVSDWLIAGDKCARRTTQRKKMTCLPRLMFSIGFTEMVEVSGAFSVA